MKRYDLQAYVQILIHSVHEKREKRSLTQSFQEALMDHPRKKNASACVLLAYYEARPVNFLYNSRAYNRVIHPKYRMHVDRAPTTNFHLPVC